MGGSSPSSRDQRETLLRCIASVAVIAAALAVLLIPMARSAPEQLLADAIHAFNEGDYSTAGQLTSRILEQDASRDAARLIAGLSAEKLYQAEREAELLTPLATDGTGSYESLLAAYAVGKRWLKLGHLGQAEQCFEYVIQHWPEHPGVNREYAYLMQIQGRTFESLNPVLQRVRQGIFGSTELHVLGSSEKRFIRGDDEIQRCRENCPDDCRILMPQARRAFLSNDADTAESLYTSILQQAPSLVQPHVDLGRILVNAGRCEEFLKLDQADAVREARHPGIWLNRALYAEQQSSLPAAIGCLRRALEIAPDHVEVNYLMSQFLSRDGQAELSQFFGQRARILAEIELIVPEFYDNPTMDHVRRMESGFRNTGRFWEAAAVAQFATRMNDGDPSWGTDALRRNATLLNAQGRDSLAVMISSEDRRLLASYSEDYRKLRSPPASGSLELAADDPAADATAIRFEDRAAMSGLDFTYFNGSLSTRGMEHIFETTGGGTVAVDIDQDGWTDVYLTQGAGLWEGERSDGPTDRLFLNQTGVFRDVTSASGLGDPAFSQGATAGDFDNDGFPDLYVCNLYENRFYHNNGDGTFNEITASTETAGDEWSLSSAIVDLNQDSLPDLYVVNYLQRESVLNRRCKNNGEPLTCAPTLFPAEQDRVYLNLGDGQFAERTQESGIILPDGKGLAVLAADFDQQGEIELFIGNDTTPNFFLVNQGVSGNVSYSDQAIAFGLAVDGTGRSQATMGAAWADTDANGLCDLFITNFYQDANTFYHQSQPLTFVDQTRTARLYDSSIETLGFGTQFIDANADGSPDLFVTNGHVDRTFATGAPDEMPPQLYVNDGAGRFDLVAASEVGPYFEGQYLGRSVCRLDWNQDLLDDILVLHLYRPVALLTNSTDAAEHGQSVQIFLRGITCDRDAVGATIRTTVNGRTQVHQITAGDGYMTSNQRCVTVGAKRAERLDRVEVRWPDGEISEFTDLPTGRRYLLRQDGSQPYQF